MKTIQISDRLKVELPDNYQRMKLGGPVSAKKWANALRSGKYSQGSGCLCDEDDYCCLGVLCKLQKRPIRKEYYDSLPSLIFDSSSCQLSKENPAFSSLGDTGNFPSGVAVFQYVAGDWISRFTLARLNDEGIPFAEIADLIELLWE